MLTFVINFLHVSGLSEWKIARMLPSKDKACYEAGWGVWSNFFVGQCYCKFSFGVSVSNVSAPISKWHPGVFFPYNYGL